MNNRNPILPNFLKMDFDRQNVLQNFDLGSYVNIILKKNIIICPICLKECIKPSSPNSCGHIFC